MTDRRSGAARLGFILVIVSALLAFAAPARAQSPCERYGETLLPGEIDQIHQTLDHLAPVKYAEASRKMIIVNGDELDDVAPFATPAAGGKAAAITVPRGFRRLQCRLVLMQLYFLAGAARDTVSAAKLDRCVAEGRRIPDCIGSLADGFAQAHKGIALDDAGKTLLWNVADAAFLDTMLHEFAHIALGHFDRAKDGAGYARIEAEADTYALLHTVISGGTPLGGFSTFAILSIADGHLEDGGGLHDRFACRASVAREAMAKLMTPAQDAFSWVMGGAAAYRQRRATPAPFPFERLHIIASTAECRPPDAAVIEAVRDDLTRITQLLDRSAAETPESQLRPIEALAKLPLRTEEGRIQRASLVALRWRLLQREDADDRLGTQGMPSAEALLASSDTSVMSSEDYGRLLSAVAITRYNNAARGSTLDSEIRALDLGLKKAAYYFQANGLAETYGITVAWAAGDCARASRHMLRAIDLSEHPERTRQRFDSDRARVAALGCEAYTAAFRDEIKRSRGWR